MAIGVSPIPSPRFCFTCSSTTTLRFIHPRRPAFRPKQRPIISMSFAGDSSSSSLLGVSNDAGLKITSSCVIGQNDLLIVGPGVLGRIVAEKWKKEYPDCQIYGHTMTTDHHDELMKIGVIPSLRESMTTNKFPYVIFCAPPYQTTDYPGDVRLAASNWSGEGALLFTSSSAVYDCSDNGFCDEDCPVVPIGRSRRTDVLLGAEKEALDAGGCIVRLAGLYISSLQFTITLFCVMFCLGNYDSIITVFMTLYSYIYTFYLNICYLNYLYKDDRGPHVYWLDKGTVDARPDHVLNLIHYEDAASLSIAIMKKKLRGRIFLGCDSHPLSRQEIMDYVNQSGKFNKKFICFTGTDGPLGKRMNNSKTRTELGWEPKFTSFPQFLGLTG